MRKLRWIVPLAIFVVAASAFLWRRPVARSARGALAARSASRRRRSRSRSCTRPARTLGHADMKGKVWLLNVWASWCVSCRVEHPLLVELAKANVVPVVGLDYKDKPDDGQGVARAARRSLPRCRSWTSTAASASTRACTACPRPSSSTSRASSATSRSARSPPRRCEQKILPLVRSCRTLVSAIAHCAARRDGVRAGGESRVGAGARSRARRRA